jgi:hypothetical protein
MNRKLYALFFIFLLPIISNASESDIDMADVMRSNGKIYVVVAVLAIIFICLLIYLLIIDKKVRKIESGRNTK